MALSAHGDRNPGAVLSSGGGVAHGLMGAFIHLSMLLFAQVLSPRACPVLPPPARMALGVRLQGFALGRDSPLPLAESSVLPLPLMAAILGHFLDCRGDPGLHPLKLGCVGPLDCRPCAGCCPQCLASYPTTREQALPSWQVRNQNFEKH